MADRLADTGAYRDPDFLRTCEDRGESLHVEENGRHTVELKVIPSTWLRVSRARPYDQPGFAVEFTSPRMALYVDWDSQA